MLPLPVTPWGDGGRRALLVHGINGSAGSWWSLGEALADAGWTAIAVDLRGHGRGPRSDDYRIQSYADDLPAGPWDLVVGHSLGGAIAIVAAERVRAQRMVLIDPVVEIPAAHHEAVRADQLDELTQGLDAIRAARPGWHPRDIAAKHEGITLADRETVERTFAQNDPWDLIERTESLTVPTLVLSGDPAVYTTFPPALARRVSAANPLIDYRVIAGAGHSPHRDRPQQTFRLMLDWLG